MSTVPLTVTKSLLLGGNCHFQWGNNVFVTDGPRAASVKTVVCAHILAFCSHDGPVLGLLLRVEKQMPENPIVCLF